jgi:hypothetical protein
MDDLKECREEFEAWAQKEGYNVSPQPETGRYWDSHVEARWNGWQAAWNRRAVPQANAEQDAPVKLSMSMVASVEYLKGWNDCVDAIRAASKTTPSSGEGSNDQ